jgi:ceramide glucosyltransferase
LDPLDGPLSNAANGDKETGIQMITAATVFTAWAWFAALFSLVALFRVAKWRRVSSQPQVGSSARVVLLRPVDAPTAEERTRLSESIAYDGPLEQWVLSPFRLRLPETTRWLPSDPPTRNRKVGHLLYGLRALEAEGKLDERTLVLSVDADVRVDAALIRALTQGLEQGAALTTAAPEPEIEPGANSSWPARAWRSLLLHTHHSFVALHAMSAGPRAVCGKALGLSAMAQRILPSLTDHVGEDLELAKRVSAQGGQVVLAQVPARVPQDPAACSREVLSRLTRWMQVLRAHRPMLYPAVPLLFAPTLPVLFGALVLGGNRLITAAAVLVIARIALSLALKGGSGLEWFSGELLLGAAFLQSLTARTLQWRGRYYALLKGGRMRPAPAPWPESVRHRMGL